MITRRQKIELRSKKNLFSPFVHLLTPQLASFHTFYAWAKSRRGKPEGETVDNTDHANDVLALEENETGVSLHTIPNRRIVFHGNFFMKFEKSFRNLASNGKRWNPLLAMSILSIKAVKTVKTFSQAQLRGTIARGEAVLRDINITTGLNRNLLASNSTLQEKGILQPAFASVHSGKRFI